MAARCAYCGEALRPHSMFCLSCGQLVAQPSPPPQAAYDVTTETSGPRSAAIDPPPVGPGRAPVAVPGVRASSFRLRFSTGAVHSVDGQVLVGRNPQSAAEAEGIAGISINDAVKSVSRVHAHLQAVGDQLWVTDRGSANGSHIARGGKTTDCPVDTPTAARAGDTVWFGSVSCNVLIDDSL